MNTDREKLCVHKAEGIEMIPKLSDKQKESIARSHGTGGWQTLADMVKHAEAVEAAVHQQYAEWMAKQEPAATWVAIEHGQKHLKWSPYYADSAKVGDKLFIHPAPDDTNVRDAEAELNCAEEVLESLSIDLPMEETGFDCLGDYVTAVFEAQKKKDTKLLKQALDALWETATPKGEEAIKALRERLNDSNRVAV
jgi:hypothetical protein